MKQFNPLFLKKFGGHAAFTGVLAASLVLAGVLYLGFRSHSLGIGDASVQNSAKISAQAVSPNRAPHLVNAAYAMPAPADKDSSPALVKKGRQLFQSHTCAACHGPTAQGSAIAPPLAGIGHYFNEPAFSQLIHHPNSQMTAKGMPPAPLSDAETHALWTYLNSLPVPAHLAPGVPPVVTFKKTAAGPHKSTTPAHAIAAARSQHRTAPAAA